MFNIAQEKIVANQVSDTNISYNVFSIRRKE